VRLETVLGRANVSGDAQLVDRVFSNLIDNAIRYNSRGGHVQIGLAARSTETTLTVTNTGPVVPPDQIDRLLEPFQHAAPDRTAGPNWLGPGLSLVADIARAHEPQLAADHGRPANLHETRRRTGVLLTRELRPPWSQNRQRRPQVERADGR